MDPQRFQRISEIFEAARQHQPDTRAEFLDTACSDDRDLRNEVQSMLDHHDDPGGALDTPAVDSGVASIAIGAALEESSAARPARIGPYRILDTLGEGGMGVVYLAEQDKPRRTVALKVISAGVASKSMLRRFEHETHVLGRLQHPGIAQVFEAGTADSGHGAQPYFAMEYVAGRPLIQHANANNLGTRERLELMARVCDAVQYAHQHGVIHRDLKPDNIIVDELGQPKILDFGVARATDTDRQLTTMRTSMGQLIGTLPYMSPEQVLADPTGVDTRSDVYSLGVILYQLLSGRLPYDLEKLSIIEAARVIREEEPLRLSSINRIFRGEIETLIAKALEKDKARRYQSALALAADIRHFLHDEPIEAKRDSVAYVIRKQVKRHRWAVTAAAVFIIALMSFVVFALIQAEQKSQLAQREQRAKNEALAALSESNEARRLTARTAARLESALAESNIERGRLFGRTGHITAAEDLIWREHLRNPASLHTFWALWELYSRNPSPAAFAADDGIVRDTAFSPDGRSLATAGDDGTIKLWDASSFQLIDTLEGHAGTVWSIRFSPDGRIVASAGADGTIILWDVQAHRIIRTLRGHDGAVRTVSFSPDGTRLASGGEDATVRIWDTASGDCIATLAEHSGHVARVCFSPDGKTIASGSNDATIKLWTDWPAPSATTLKGHEGTVLSLTFSPDGETLFSGSTDRLIKLWDVSTGQCIQTLSVPNGTVRSVLFSPDGRTFTSGGWWTIDLWDPATWQRRRSLPLHKGALGVSYSPDGRLIATAGGGSVHVWDIATGAAVRRLAGHRDRVVAALSPDGRIVASGDAAGIVRLWEASTGRLLVTFKGHAGRIKSIQFSPDGLLLAAGSDAGSLRLWSLADGSRVGSFDGHLDPNYSAICFSPDGRIIASTCIDWTTKLREVSTGRVLTTIPSDGYQPLSICFSPDGNLLASISRRHIIKLWSVSGRQIAALSRNSTPWTATFSPDGQKIASGTWDRTIEIWNADSGTLDASLEGHNGVVWAVAFNPANLRLLASAAADGTVRLWDIVDQRCLATLDAFNGDVLSVAFGPDGHTIIAAGADEAVRIWDLTYFDRHIAGNLRYQIDRFRDELGDTIKTDYLIAWADEVLNRPSTRWAPEQHNGPGQDEPALGLRGIDPDVIAAWGRPGHVDALRAHHPNSEDSHPPAFSDDNSKRD